MACGRNRYSAQRGRRAQLSGTRRSLPSREVRPVEVAGIVGAKAITVAAEHVRHLQHRARHGGWLRRGRTLQREPIERTPRRCDQMCGDLRVACRCRELRVAEQGLDDADVPCSRSCVAKQWCNFFTVELHLVLRTVRADVPR